MVTNVYLFNVNQNNVLGIMCCKAVCYCKHNISSNSLHYSTVINYNHLSAQWEDLKKKFV